MNPSDSGISKHQPPILIMKTLKSFLLVAFLAAVLVPTKMSADGGFVISKFVWDKHKDINEPKQKAILVYDGGSEDLILQVKYEGPVDEFGWLIPVPNLPTVQKGSMKCFYELSQFTQQRFELGFQMMSAGLARDNAGGNPEPPVKVNEIKTVGAYQIAVFRPRLLMRWQNGWMQTSFIFPRTRPMCWTPTSSSNGILSQSKSIWPAGLPCSRRIGNSPGAN